MTTTSFNLPQCPLHSHHCLSCQAELFFEVLDPGISTTSLSALTHWREDRTRPPTCNGKQSRPRKKKTSGNVRAVSEATHRFWLYEDAVLAILAPDFHRTSAGLVKSKDCVVGNGVAKNRPGKHVGWMVGLQGQARKPNQTR